MTTPLYYPYNPDRGKLPPTRRQLEVIAYFGEGRNRKEVARALGISLQTVKNHMTALYKRIGAENQIHALAILLQRRYLLVDHYNSMSCDPDVFVEIVINPDFLALSSPKR